MLQLGALVLASRGLGPASRSLLAVPRLLASEGWNDLFGTNWPTGTVLPSYLYNATVPPPYTYTNKNVTVVEECKTGTWDCECLILGTDCMSAKKGKEMPYAETCAVFNQAYKPTQEQLWTLIVGAIMAAIMAFGIGANDSANSWATAIGSGAIRASIGLMIGGAMEFSGAVLLGYAVSGTIQKGIAPLEDPECWACGYCNSKMAWYNAAMVATLIGAVFLTLLATYTAMPISTTHAVIGGCCGATVAATSWGCLNWSFSGGGLFAVMASWVVSPLFSGTIGAISNVCIVQFALKRNNPRKHALIAVVACSFLTSFIMVFMVMLKSNWTKKLPKLIMLAAGVGAGIVVSAIFAFIIVPMLRKNWPSDKHDLQANDDVEMSKNITKVDEEDDGDDFELSGEAATGRSGNRYVDAVNSASKRERSSSNFVSFKSIKEMSGHGTFKQSIKEALSPDMTADEVLNYDFIPEEVREAKKAGEENYSVGQLDAVWSFRYLLVYQAALESFAHGANDTANATGAFMAVYNTYHNGIYDCNMDDNVQWIMAVAGLFVALGVNTFGYRVVKTIGTNMTDVNFVRGWCVEFATTTAVVFATMLGMPVSTTHCVVGAVVFIGLTQFGLKGVAWGLVGKIGLSWIVTLPIAGAVGYIFSWLLSFGVKA